MHVGIALKPDTPVEHVFPYVEAGDIDLVSDQSPPLELMICRRLRDAYRLRHQQAPVKRPNMLFHRQA